MTAHSSQASAPSEGGGNADTEVRASLSDHAVLSEDLPPARPKYLPRPVSGADAAFGGQAMKILPPMSAIPEGFDSPSNPWVRWQMDWFYKGLDRYPVAREGIDLKLAMANLACAQRSFEPKHEHKQAGVAYLASLWFTSPDGEQVKQPTKEQA